VNLSFQGTAQAFQASLSSMPLLVAAAILVVYICWAFVRKLYPSHHDFIRAAGPPVSVRWYADAWRFTTFR